MNLTEGGNQFKNPKTGEVLTKSIQQTDVKPTVLWLEQLTGLPLLDNMLGSTGLRAESGDIDLAVDKTQTSKSRLYGILKNWAESQDLDPNLVIAGGTARDKKPTEYETMSFMAPVAGKPQLGFVQVDFMFEPNIEWARFAKRAAADTQYKDAVKHIILNSLGKASTNKKYPQGYTWSGQYGLKDRATNELITTDPQEIAELILYPGATAKDLAGVEAVVTALQRDPQRDAKLAQARTDLAPKGIELPAIKEGTPGWYRTMMGRLA
jgi:hypothetical protein